MIVCVNKVDRPEARPDEVVDETLELLMELDAGDKQLDCPFVFASAKEGFATLDLDGEKKDMKPLFETIIEHIEAPEGDPEKPLQVLISTIDYNEYVGRIGIGKVDNGEIAVNKECIVVNAHDPERKEKVRITKLYEFEGLDKVDVKNAQAHTSCKNSIENVAIIRLFRTSSLTCVLPNAAPGKPQTASTVISVSRRLRFQEIPAR